MDLLLGLFGAAVCGAAGYLVLRHPRWLAARTRGDGRPTPEQLAEIPGADLIVVRVLGIALLAFGIGFALTGIASTVR